MLIKYQILFYGFMLTLIPPTLSDSTGGSGLRCPVSAFYWPCGHGFTPHGHGILSWDEINVPLPDEIIRGGYISKDGALSYLEATLKQTLPSSDRIQIRGSMKWQFLLQQHSLVKKRKRKPKKTFLTRKQRKEMGLLKLPKDDYWQYKSLEPVREQWKQYMRGNIGYIYKAPTCQDQDWSAFSVIVAKSELIGAELKVVKSKVSSLVGMSGTVVLETKMTFQIVTPKNRLKMILKDTSVFEFVLDSLKFTFLGKHLATRPGDRSVKKLKNLMLPDLRSETSSEVGATNGM